MGKSRLLLLLFGLMVTLFLAACSSDSDESAPDSNPSAASVQTQTDGSAMDSEDSVDDDSKQTEPDSPPSAANIPLASFLLPIDEDTPTAPPIQGEGVNEWINSEELVFEELQAQNKVVLVDFWTYTCNNCIRTLPYLNRWHNEYADSGLVIIGIHTPEFEFEKSLDNLKEAIERFEIEYPIVQDNNYWNWRAFANRFWPAKYLIDKDGYVRYIHFGEGAYDQTEEAIQHLLEEAEQAVNDISGQNGFIRRVDPSAKSPHKPDGLTQEFYAGTGRNLQRLALGSHHALRHE